MDMESAPVERRGQGAGMRLDTTPTMTAIPIGTERTVVFSGLTIGSPAG